MIKVDDYMVEIEGDEISILSEVNMLFCALKKHDMKISSFSSVIYLFMKCELSKEEREEFIHNLKLLINVYGIKKEGEEDETN